MKRTLLCLLAFSLAIHGSCSKDEEKGGDKGKTGSKGTDKELERDLDKAVQAGKDDAKLSFAREHLKELDEKLASDDPGAASSICAVIKGDLPTIAATDAKLAATLEKRCGRDLAVRSLERFVEEAEAAHKKDPKDTFSKECSSFSIYMKPVIKAGATKDPKVAEIKTRYDKVCPAKK